MASKIQAATALLTEHLRYTPLSLVDDIINTVNEVTNRAIDAAEKGLLAAAPSTLGFSKRDADQTFPNARSEIEDGVHQLETLLEANIDKNFDKFELYTLRSILSVPQKLVPYIRLAHYEAIPNTSSLENIPTTESLLHTLQQVQETRKLQRALKTTMRKNEAIIKQLKALTSPEIRPGQNEPGALAFLLHNDSALKLGISPSNADSEPLTTNVSFAISQLPALQELVAQLRPQLPSLTRSINEPASESASARERRMYIELQVRKAVERQGIISDDVLPEHFGKIPSLEEVDMLESILQDMSD